MIETSSSAAFTEKLGAGLAKDLRTGDLVLLEGDLAAGKTTLVRGLVRGLEGNSDDVSSPTFVVIQSYDCGLGTIRRLHHVDLYRLADGSQRAENSIKWEVTRDPGNAVVRRSPHLVEMIVSDEHPGLPVHAF